MPSLSMNDSVVGEVTEQYKVVAISACFFGLIFSLCFNILLLVLHPRVANQFGENSRLCLMCVAVIDLLGGTLCFGSRIVFEFDRSLILDDRTACPIVAASCTTFVCQSNFLFTIISIDRYIAITKPMRYCSMLSRTRINRLIIFAIATGSAVSIARMFHGIYTDSCDFDPGASMYVGNHSLLVYITNVIFLGSITGYLNIKVLIVAHKHHTRISNMHVTDEESQHASPRMGGKFRSAVTITTMIAAYYVVWTPYTIGVIVVTTSGEPLSEVVYFSTLYIAFSNHFLNATIHFGLQKKLRQKLIRLLGIKEEDSLDQVT